MIFDNLPKEPNFFILSRQVLKSVCFCQYSPFYIVFKTMNRTSNRFPVVTSVCKETLHVSNSLVLDDSIGKGRVLKLFSI